MSKPRKQKPLGADGHRSRMYSKFLRSASGDMPIRDIVEMILYYSVRVCDTRDRAVELMGRYNGDIQKLLNAPPEELCKTDDIGPRSALILNVVGEITSRLESGISDDTSTPKMSSDDIVDSLMDECAKLTEDAVAAIFLRFPNDPIDVRILNTGLTAFNENDMYAILNLAAGFDCSLIIIAHLCAVPGFPSAADTKFRRYISDALQTTGISLCDYYFITSDEALVLE